jgi:ferredoxin
MAYAFRCKKCNSLAEASHAGERSVPAKCSTCGAGVSFSPEGVITYDESNWIVLADLSDAELKPILDYHKIADSDIEEHVPAMAAAASRSPLHVVAETSEGMGAEDKA